LALGERKIWGEDDLLAYVGEIHTKYNKGIQGNEFRISRIGVEGKRWKA
jgi:hypothetical protein